MCSLFLCICFSFLFVVVFCLFDLSRGFVTVHIVHHEKPSYLNANKLFCLSVLAKILWLMRIHMLIMTSTFFQAIQSTVSSTQVRQKMALSPYLYHFRFTFGRVRRQVRKPSERRRSVVGVARFLPIFS